jgi:LCP family protein required for cell wall assembly
VPDGPEEHEPVEATPDQPLPDQPARPAEPDEPEIEAELPKFNALEDMPTGPPVESLLTEEDLAWVDKPEVLEEERERRRERREAHKEKVRKQRRKRRALKISGAALATLLVLVGFWFFWTFGGLTRMPEVAGQGGADTPGTNFLLIGDNPSEPDESSITGTGYRHAFKSSDMVMVLHVTQDGDTMFVVSIPGTSILPIPAHGSDPATRGQLADAYAAGGTKLYVKTVEEYTGIAMDRVVVLDMAGLRDITDQVGGAMIDVPSDACQIPVGPHRFNGEAALKYTALYPCLPGHDLDRVQRQQALLRALMRDTVDGGSLGNPFTLSKLLRDTASHLTLEDGFGYPSIFSTLFSMRGLRSTSTTFLTAPASAKPFSKGVDSVVLDPQGNQDLWAAVRADKVQTYLTLNQDVVVG